MAQGTAIADTTTIINPTGFEITSEQGTAVAPNEDVTLTGQQIQSDVGIIIGGGSAVVPLTGISITPSVGIIDPEDQVMGLTGQSFNANVGSVSIEDQVVGLTGFTITATVGTPFIIHYQDVDTGSNTNYTGVSTGSNSNYSDVATGSNTSYTDVAA